MALITATTIVIKIAKSKAAKKAARKAIKTAKQHVKIDARKGEINIDAAGRTYRINRETFKRETATETTTTPLTYN